MYSADSRYSRDRLLGSFSSAESALSDLQRELNELSSIGEDEFSRKVYEKAIESDFITFAEFIQHMCKAYLVNKNIDGVVDFTSVDAIKKAKELGFFQTNVSELLIRCIRLRNNYVHEYWKRAVHGKAILNMCFGSITNMTMFLDIVNEKLIIEGADDNSGISGKDSF